MRYTHFRNVWTPIQRRPLTAFEKFVLFALFVVFVAVVLVMMHTEPSEWGAILIQTWAA